MVRLVKIIAGLSSSMLAIGLVIIIWVYFPRKEKNQTSTTESPSNTTISSAINTVGSTVMSTLLSMSSKTTENSTVYTNIDTMTSMSMDTTMDIGNDVLTSADSNSSPNIMSSETTGNSTVYTNIDTMTSMSMDTTMDIGNDVLTSADSNSSPNIMSSTAVWIDSSISINIANATSVETSSSTSTNMASPTSAPTSTNMTSPTSAPTSTNMAGPTSAATSTNMAGATSIATATNTSAIAVSNVSTNTTATMLPAITNATSVNMIVNTTGSVSATATAAVTSNSSVCRVGFKAMVSYTPSRYVGTNFVAVGDFNSDSYLDIAVANYDDRSVGILLGNGDGTFLDEAIFFAGNNTDPTVLAVGDFNNDHRMDVVIANLENWNIVVLLGNGDGTLTVQSSASTGSNSYPSAIATGYFNNDNILDVAVANSGTNRIGIFIGNGNGTFQTQKTVSTGSGSVPYAVAAGDFNHDNLTDLAVANFGNNKVSVFLGFGNGSFRPRLTFSAGNGSSWINVADLNGDSHLDIAVLNVDSNNIGILLGMGNGTFTTQTTYTIGNSNSTGDFVIADANKDGQWDIVVPNTVEDNIGILLGRGDGTFTAQIIFSVEAGSMPYVLAVADFNRDNRSDIVVANSGADTVGVLLGAC